MVHLSLSWVFTSMEYLIFNHVINKLSLNFVCNERIKSHVTLTDQSSAETDLTAVSLHIWNILFMRPFLAQQQFPKFISHLPSFIEATAAQVVIGCRTTERGAWLISSGPHQMDQHPWIVRDHITSEVMKNKKDVLHVVCKQMQLSFLGFN